MRAIAIAFAARSRPAIALRRPSAKNHSLEYVAPDLHAALAAVTEVIGAESDDAILDSVFAQFCIGK